MRGSTSGLVARVRRSPSSESAMSRTRLPIVIVCTGLVSSIATIVAQRHVQKSTVFDWSTADTKPNDWGKVRQVVRTPTPTLEELEIHISTLNPGKSPHAPHQHQHEEIIIVKEGTLETYQSGATSRVGPGGIIFQASNE